MLRLLGFLSVVTISTMAVAVEMTPAEKEEARSWVAAKFKGASGQGVATPCQAALEMLDNHGAVQQNSRGGKPMHLGTTAYARGLYCHANSKIVVHLPSPGKSFEAIAGVDTNDQTSGGRGSVVFGVQIGGQELWNSGLMHEGTPGKPVAIELNGAKEFTIAIGDGGDGISCDQADWLDARVTLDDGQVLWLGDLPIRGQQRAPYSTEPFFSFTYGGKSSRELLASWRREETERKLDDLRTERVVAYSDRETGLVVRCVGIVYADFPTVEWTVHFKNTGVNDTPILSDIQAIDARFERNADGEFLLRHHRGDSCAVNSFEPLQTILEPKSEQHFAPTGGRPTNGEWPYYSLSWPGEGIIFVVGWPGQWASSFTRDDKNSLQIKAGQELTHFVLHPGEEARTPLILLQFYKGDPRRAQNVWRRFMFAHVFPKPKEGALGPILAACSGWQFPNLMCNQAGEIQFIDRYLEEKIPLDYWWMDAGWYPCDGVGWPKVGTWEVDAKRYPGGLRAVTDHAHAKGVKGLVWFEPERVHPGTWLPENHPEWVWGGKDGGLLNLGNPDARQWLTDHVDKLLTEQGIDLYRQDFNIDPLDFWRKNDAPDRVGLTEMRHVEGYLAYWDELRRRHPGMLIDSCASGGRRDDLETMRRAVPLLRTDFEFDTTGNQCCTYGFDQWLPYHECGNREIEPYNFRSNMAVWMGFCWDVRRTDLNYDLGRKLVGQWKQVAQYYLGDFYPLTSYSTADDVWMAWQFDRPDLGEGLVQAFRRSGCIYETARIPLQSLDPEKKYRITNLDDPDHPEEVGGKELGDKGLRIVLDKRPGAALFVYEPIR